MALGLVWIQVSRSVYDDLGDERMVDFVTRNAHLAAQEKGCSLVGVPQQKPMEPDDRQVVWAAIIEHDVAAIGAS